MMNSITTPQELSMIKLELKTLTMQSALSVGEKRMVSNSGTLETVGVQLGVKEATSESLEE